MNQEKTAKPAKIVAAKVIAQQRAAEHAQVDHRLGDAKLDRDPRTAASSAPAKSRTIGARPSPTGSPR